MSHLKGGNLLLNTNLSLQNTLHTLFGANSITKINLILCFAYKITHAHAHTRTRDIVQKCKFSLS